MAKATVSLGGRDILGFGIRFPLRNTNSSLNRSEMKRIMKRDIKKVPSLRGKSIINLFYEPSTRTRTSFELAGKYLGADVVNITTSSSSVVKGECLRDTILTVQSMACDAIVMRHLSKVPQPMLPMFPKLLSSTQVTVPMHILLRDCLICLPSASRAKILKALKWQLSAIFYTACCTHQHCCLDETGRGSTCCRPDDFNSARY